MQIPKGSSIATASPIASVFSAIPGPEVVVHASAFNGLRWLPFGFGVDGVSVVIFLIAWFPAVSESIATYGLIAEWTAARQDWRERPDALLDELIAGAERLNGGALSDDVAMLLLGEQRQDERG